MCVPHQVFSSVNVKVSYVLYSNYFKGHNEQNCTHYFLKTFIKDRNYSHTYTYTRKWRKTRTNTVQISKVKNFSCEECGKRENHCTPLKLESKIQAKKVAIERCGES